MAAEAAVRRSSSTSTPLPDLRNQRAPQKTCRGLRSLRLPWPRGLATTTAMLLLLPCLSACSVDSESAEAACAWRAERPANNPLITPTLPGLEGERGENINGPSVIRVPEWVEKPLGKYYLYFAHHRGRSIRLAYADDPLGPWQVYEADSLHIEHTAASDHIASPDVHVDHGTREIRMYFHGLRAEPGRRQATYRATSNDGIRFQVASTPLGWEYFRVFERGGWFYAVAKKANRGHGVIMRSRDGHTPFEEGPSIIPRMRHATLLTRGKRIWLLYTRVDDAPERILASELNLEGDWRQWHAGRPVHVLQPETAYEGADLPLKASRYGVSADPENALRDPYVFEDGGVYYLYYAVRGEKAIAAARLQPDFDCLVR